MNLILHFISKYAGVIFQRLCAVSILRGRTDIKTSTVFFMVQSINRSCERSLLYRTVRGWQQKVCRIVVTCAFCRGNWYLHVVGRPNIRWVNVIQGDLRTMKINNSKKCVQNRVKWKELGEKAKTCKQWRFSAWRWGRKRKKRNKEKEKDVQSICSIYY